MLRKTQLMKMRREPKCYSQLLSFQDVLILCVCVFVCCFHSKIKKEMQSLNARPTTQSVDDGTLFLCVLPFNINIFMNVIIIAVAHKIMCTFDKKKEYP